MVQQLISLDNMKFHTKEARLKQADSFISMGDKFFWTPLALSIVYIFKFENVHVFQLDLFYWFIFFSFIFLYIGVKLNTEGLLVYEEVHKSTQK